MATELINEINNFPGFYFDNTKNKIINRRDGEETNLEEFLAIQHLLDNNRVQYTFEKNFNIKVIK